MRLFQEAGLPDGVINLVYGSGATIGDAALASPHLAGIHFTGSTAGLQRDVADRRRRTWSATATTRASSARRAARTSSSPIRPPTSTRSRRRSCAARSSTRARSARPSSRVYAPSNLWPALRERLAGGGRDDQDRRRLRLRQLHGRGDRRRLVPDAGARRSRRRRRTPETEIVVGGGYDDSQGYFVEPTVIETRDPDFRLMREELFGPVVTTYVYDEKRWDETLDLIDSDRAVRPDGRGLLGGPRRDRRRAGAAPLRGRQLLRQRQADRRGRRPAAVRRRARVRHERQGRLDVEPDPLGQPAHDQGDVHPADATTATRSWTRTPDSAGT